ncbi:MAG: hypothetical protein CFE24_15010 [Flavobacterium sp. BFFFF2]|nr:MAG: hypothetical protein CFE24_15010 [Flavobacterium sp. BFFFF2]
MQRIINNLKPDCCTNNIRVVGNPILKEVKLFDKIEDACHQNQNNSWYPIEDVVDFNNMANRPTGIVCHSCKNENKKEDIENVCVISLIIDNHKNTRFSLSDSVEVR